MHRERQKEYRGRGEIARRQLRQANALQCHNTRITQHTTRQHTSIESEAWLQNRPRTRRSAFDGTTGVAHEPRTTARATAPVKPSPTAQSAAHTRQDHGMSRSVPAQNRRLPARLQDVTRTAIDDASQRVRNRRAVATACDATTMGWQRQANTKHKQTRTYRRRSRGRSRQRCPLSCSNCASIRARSGTGRFMPDTQVNARQIKSHSKLGLHGQCAGEQRALRRVLGVGESPHSLRALRNEPPSDQCITGVRLEENRIPYGGRRCAGARGRDASATHTPP